uniref:EGF-like domain-containing protein n=1 Tax=Anopheles maculatus TaxID=74869 RepID=A0A182TBL0_9DIPT
MTGDPFSRCYEIVTTPPPLAEPRDPCYPSPCGINARCRPANGGTAICECIENYFGNPYETCRPECVSNGDCQKSLACINNRCKDPCPGVCGRNADCSVPHHRHLILAIHRLADKILFVVY